MTFHTKRSPSQSDRFLNCAGTFAMISTVPDKLRAVHGDAARLGTATHAVGEHALKHRKFPEELRDRIVLIIETPNGEGTSILRDGAKLPKVRADEYVFIVDDDMIRSANVYVEYVRARCKELGVKEEALQLETRTNPLPTRDDTSGTADCTIDAWPEVLEVVDFKNGYIFVHAEKPQPKAYLLGKAIESGFDHKKYRATIVQPNARDEGGAVRWVEYTAAELKAFQEEYAAGIARNEEAEADFETYDAKHKDAWAVKWLRAGEHCTFCEAGPVCPARRRLAEQQAKIDFASEPNVEQLPAVIPTGEVVATSAEEVARILKWGPYLESLVTAAKEYAVRALEQGYEIPGYKLVKGKTNRKLKPGKADDLINEMIQAGFFTNSDVPQLFHPAELKSGPQLEKLLPAKKREAFNDAFLYKPEGKNTVAPASDPRPAIDSKSIALEFQDDEQTFDFG